MGSKYDRIAAELRQRIQNGQYPKGERMPVETALQAEFKVSLATMRRALDELEAQGLIEKRQGIGNFVRSPRTRVRRTTDRYQWEKDRVRQPETQRRTTGATEYETGLTVTDLDFHADYRTVQADDDLAQVFAVPAGTRLLQRTYRTRNKDEGVPLSLIESYLVYDMISGNPDLLDVSQEPWPGGTQHQLFTVGIELDRIVDEVIARPPTPAESEALGLNAGISVLVLRKVSIDTKGRTVEVSDVIMPGDRTELVYTTQLTRWRE